MKFRISLFLALLFLSLSFCEHPRVTFGGMPDTQYHRTLQSLTKHERLYGLDKTLYETYVTYVSPQLAEQYVEEYAKIFSLTQAKKNQMLADAQADQQKFDEFLVGHYASDHDNQKLNITDPQKIIWKFFVAGDSDSLVEATSVNSVDLGAQKAYFYPHLNSWSQLYRIRFPKISPTSKKFIMKGPVRELTFNW